MIQLDASLSVNLSYTNVVNYSIQQNKIPIIRKLIVKNLTAEDITNIEISIYSATDFIHKWSQKLDQLSSNESIDISVAELRLSAKYLADITEKVVEWFSLSITANEVTLYSQNFEIDILPYDQWNGTSHLPEILSAFVTPNNPALPKIILDASTVLAGWTNNPSMDAYQSKSHDRVKKQLGALFESIAKLNIVYCSPPASFEVTGQRIRTCDTIIQHKLGTCIDMAILYASCIEAVGLHPLLIIIKGHAFVGAWLVEETFADSVNDDVSLLKKRIASGINEILLIEATAMNSPHGMQFDEAIHSANAKLEKDEDFVLFVDIKRARLSKIKPLPQRISGINGYEILEDKSSEDGIRLSNIPDVLDTIHNDSTAPNIEMTKQKIWERKLLDLSLRNNLLNLRGSKSSTQLFSIDLNLIEDALADGKEFELLTKPSEWSNADERTGVFHKISPSDPIAKLLKSELSQKKLRTYLTETELKKNLTDLYRSSRESMEEGGANTLFLALGMLKWFETDKSETPRFAPILLLPVELIRKSAQFGYVLRSREEDTIMNVTLLEMIKQDFDIQVCGLDELPRDESGVDVGKIFSIVRRNIMSRNRWDLEEIAFLGTFSFSKFIMWNDIHSNAEKLAENQVVDSIMSGRLKWQPANNDADLRIDTKYHPSEMAIPISADSSQLEAIYAAAQNESFVLHGPPGTGKSQTITNIIANSLFQGKRVLFVAEKMAALSVVQKRLADIGLDPFCLELHSNKSKKTTILDQLQKSTEVVKVTAPQVFSKEAERLHIARTELNEYVDALHCMHPIGYSLYDLFTLHAGLSSIQSEFSVDSHFIERFTNQIFVNSCDAVEELQNAASLCGSIGSHPLSEVECKSFSNQTKADFGTLSADYANIIRSFTNEISVLLTDFGLSGDEWDRPRTATLLDLLTQIAQLPDTPRSILQAPNIDRTLGEIIRLSHIGHKRDELRTKLLNVFTKDILTINAEAISAEWNNAGHKWLLPKLLGERKIIKSIQLFSKQQKIVKQDVAGFLEMIVNYQSEEEIIQKNSSQLSIDLGFLWKNGDCEWQQVIDICRSSIEINKQVFSVFDTLDQSAAFIGRLCDMLAKGSDIFKQTKGKLIENARNNYISLGEIESRLSKLLNINFNKPIASNWLKYWGEKANQWQASIDLLRDWVSWNVVKDKALSSNLEAVVVGYQNGSIRENGLQIYQKAVYRAFAESIIERDPRLSVFNGKLFDSKISKFKELSNYFEQLTKAEIIARLSEKIPSFTQEASNSSEPGILQRAIKSKGRAMSIRKLFDQIPNLLPRLCPCMLMSPMSIAQFFKADTSLFDLIIFDEASQLLTCDAIGAMARAKNVIVVGDPKQMPPTSFFGSNKKDEDNTEIEDMESILDDCLTISMPSKYLLWHYRSKHESLIAFSNTNFYDNKLFTFPSPDDLVSKISNQFVPGYYDRGKTAQNHFEAKAIVADILRRLSQPELAKRSIGVVAFSLAQRNIIEDLLNEAFASNPELERIADQNSERIFVKNLENVQGDERDVILFSMGYGPDSTGKVTLNFGPLNREGGWRRLNVAVSRARYEMRVFSTLRASEIDISRTSSEGIAGIKAFLEFSENGISALPQKLAQHTKTKHLFEEMIASKISQLGYTVKTDIGCSGFKIDIGVVNPHKPSEYLLGILTDGKNYQAAQTAKDREGVQTSVLKQLGWNIYRVWSTEWWFNSQKIMSEIADMIKKIENNEEIELAECIEDNSRLLADSTVCNPDMNQDDSSNIATVLSSESTINYYINTVLEQKSLQTSDEFFNPAIREILKLQIEHVLRTEAPISHKLLARRILNAWGISRIGKRLDEYLIKYFSQLSLKKSEQDSTYFYWLDTQTPENYPNYRIAKEGDEKRSAEDLPKEEIANGIVAVLTHQISLPKTELINEVARLFGYARTGGNVEMAILLGVSYALEKGLVREVDGRIVL